VLVVEQPFAPRDGVAQRTVAFRQVGGTVDQQGERVLELRRQRGRRQGAEPRRGELDGQRQPVDVVADGLQGGAGVPVEPGRVEVRGDGGRTRQQQVDGVAERERSDRQLVLHPGAQRSAARGEHGQLRPISEEFDDLDRQIRELLEVVEDEQPGSVVQCAAELVAHVGRSAFVHPDEPSDGEQRELGVVDVVERHERHPGRPRRRDRGGCGSRQAGLADTTWAGQRDEPARCHRGERTAQVLVAPDQRRRWGHGRPPTGGRGAVRTPVPAVGCSAQEALAMVSRQTEGVGEGPDRVRVRVGADPTFELADAVDGESGAVGELLL
jgi:hypothetical protein